MPRSRGALLFAFRSHLSPEQKYAGAKSSQYNKAAWPRMGLFRSLAARTEFAVKDESHALVDHRILHTHGDAAPLLIFTGGSIVNAS